VRTRIFGAASALEPAAAGPRIRLADFTRWVVPAFGCFLLVVGTLSSRYPAQRGLQLSATNFLGAENGFTEMVIASGTEHCDKNSLPAGRLEWSFGGRSNTGHLGAVPVSYTNTIIQ
jgi:hypothetical protein